MMAALSIHKCRSVCYCVG